MPSFYGQKDGEPGSRTALQALPAAIPYACFAADIVIGVQCWLDMFSQGVAQSEDAAPE